MREKILLALQTKFQGVDAKTLGRIADKLAETTTEEQNIQTAVDGVTIQQLMESYGDARATDAQKSAVKNYETKYGLKDGKAITKPEPPKSESPKPTDTPKPADEAPAYVKALMEQMKAMQKRLDDNDAAKVTSGRKSKVDAMLKDAPEQVRTMYAGSFDNMQFADDAAFDTWLASSKTNVEALTAAMNAKGSVTTPPKNGGGSNQQENPLVLAYAEKSAKAQPSAIVGKAAETAPAK